MLCVTWKLVRRIILKTDVFVYFEEFNYYVPQSVKLMCWYAFLVAERVKIPQQMTPTYCVIYHMFCSCALFPN